ncbi:MAG: hypothetical protein ACO2O1_08260 [Candidatus Caldarchaeales archaeon]|jgi:hypothetical protein
MEADEVIAAIIAFGVVFWAIYLQVVLNKVGESMLWFWLAMAIFLGARVVYDARTIKYRIYGLDVKEEEVRKAAVEIAAKTNIISVALMGVWLGVLVLLDGIYGFQTVSENPTLFYGDVAFFVALALFTLITIKRLYSTIYDGQEAP